MPYATDPMRLLLLSLSLALVPAGRAQVELPGAGPLDPTESVPLVEAAERSAWEAFRQAVEYAGRVWTADEDGPAAERVRLARRWAMAASVEASRARALFSTLAWIREDRGDDVPACRDERRARSVLSLFDFWPLQVMDLRVEPFEGSEPETTVAEQRAAAPDIAEAAAPLLERRADSAVDVCPPEPAPAPPPPPPGQ